MAFSFSLLAQVLAQSCHSEGVAIHKVDRSHGVFDGIALRVLVVALAVAAVCVSSGSLGLALSLSSLSPKF
jgi:hypothetical protein